MTYVPGWVRCVDAGGGVRGEFSGGRGGRAGGGDGDGDHADDGGVWGPDVTLHVQGTGFTPETVILFNGLEEPTVFVSATDVTTLVKPSLFLVPADCPVSVVGAGSR